MDDNFASGCHVSNLTLLHSFQMLLLGLLMCCGSAVIHTLKPTTIVCSLSRVAAGASYTVVYSTFLVKLVFLVSLNGGVYLPGQLRKRKKNQEKKELFPSNITRTQCGNGGNFMIFPSLRFCVKSIFWRI